MSFVKVIMKAHCTSKQLLLLQTDDTKSFVLCCRPGNKYAAACVLKEPQHKVAGLRTLTQSRTCLIWTNGVVMEILTVGEDGYVRRHLEETQKFVIFILKKEMRKPKCNLTMQCN